MEDLDWSKLRYFKAVAARKPTGHVFLPKMSQVFSTLPKTVARVILSLDLGAVDKKLKGVSVPFLEVPPATSMLDMKHGADGKYEIVKAHGFKSLKDFFQEADSELEEPLAISLDDLENVTEGCAVRLVSTKEKDDNPVGWSPGEGIPFWHSNTTEDYGVDGKEWVYAGWVTSRHLFGDLYGFYNRKTSTFRLIFECD